ncbi:MAG TPA: chemotaxis protein CheW [Thermoanaerobaculia bacterium]|nr:chemotaxis protein CheW [Thermoanaerobaculia bacterium]
MVDLVKIRRKAKERLKEAEASAAAAEAAAGSEPKQSMPASPPPDPDPPARPVSEEPKAKVRTKKTTGPPAAGAVPASTSPGARSELAGREDVPSQPAFDRLERFKESAGTMRRDVVGQLQEGDGEELAELLTFMIANEQYAVPIDTIVEIIPPRQPTRVPNADPSIVGVISLRGTIVTMIDVCRRLGHPRIEGSDPRIIVVEQGEMIGFLVDRVSRVIKAGRGSIELHPVVTASEQSEYIDGVFQQGKSIYVLLDLERLIRSQVH